MKTKIFFSILVISVLTLKSNAQIKVISNGYVGIGTSSPQYNLDSPGSGRFGVTTWSNWTNVKLDWTGGCGAPVIYPSNDWYLQLGRNTQRIGSIFTYGIHSANYWTDSDDSLKENIDTLKNPLQKLKKTHGFTYKLKSTFVGNLPVNVKKIYKKTTTGFVSSDIIKEFPELVYKPDSFRNTYAVNYMGMIPILVEAIKQQQLQIDSLRLLVNKKSSGSLKSASLITAIDSSTSSTTDLYHNEQPILGQNHPNPFNSATTINYHISATTKNAAIYVYDLQGLQKKALKLTNKGNGSVVIRGSELVAGMYYYTLVVDGMEIDTKKMILTQ
jgi:hypothetical protein